MHHLATAVNMADLQVQAYVNWIKRFILFHDKRHLREMGPTEVQAFLAHLAVKEHVSGLTQTLVPLSSEYIENT
jgi:hypothetical protein